MKRKNFLALVAINLGVNTYWYVENFWINLYIVRNVAEQALNVSLMVAVSAIAGVLTHIIVGALSDSSKSSLGRRKIYILWGGITGCGAMSLFPIITPISHSSGIAAAVLYGIVIDTVITITGDMTTPTRLALFKECSTIGERGKLSFFIGIFSGIGAGVIQVLYMFGFNLDDVYFYIGGVFILAGAIACVLLVEDPPQVHNPRTFKECLKEIVQRDSYRTNPRFYHLLLLLALVSTGINTYSNFIAIYVEKGLGLDQELVGIVVLMVTIFQLLGGIIPAFSDRLGRKPISLFCLITGGSMLVFSYFFQTRNHLVLGFIFGIASGIAGSAMGAIIIWVQDACPKEKVSSLLAYQMVANVIPMAPGSLLGGFLADHFATGAEVYSKLFFLAAGIIILLATLPALKIKDTIQRKKATETRSVEIN
ncbi:MAG: MFS transporter [Candidatus Hodarchaeota archaeon]